MSEGRQPFVVVSLGTDHHKFDRLIDWIDQWILDRKEPVDCLVQRGFSKEPRVARSVERMPREELLELYRRSDVVVVQGGPGSILDAREVGRIPIAIPRRADLDEVVDGHQRLFTSLMVEQGDAIMVEDYPQFITQLEQALAAPDTVATSPRIARPDLATDKLEAALLAGIADHDKGRVMRRINQLLHARESHTHGS
ncbi:glycosyl transferase [Arthrobacter psychrolactophilus]|uniref:Glycosyl transferase n=1 Tax=Arthrobacter psychrolactophilus TaxID=92442 RepID=A0A2V5J4P2_9MICC|nr:glycosyl transferase [Arthrobacter psychrolactophilus]